MKGEKSISLPRIDVNHHVSFESTFMNVSVIAWIFSTTFGNAGWYWTATQFLTGGFLLMIGLALVAGVFHKPKQDLSFLDPNNYQKP